MEVDAGSSRFVLGQLVSSRSTLVALSAVFMFDREDLEGEGFQIFDRVYDIWEVIERRNRSAIVDANYSSIDLWEARWASGLKHSLRSGDDSRKHAGP